MIRIVIVRPKIWNVIVIGILPPPLRGEPKPPIACWSPWGHKTIFILPKTAHFVNSRRRTSPPRSARHLPLTRGGFSTPAPKAPLVKGSWRAAPERLPPPTAALALPPGELSAQLTERALQSPAAFALSVFAPLSHLSQRERQAHAVPPPLQGEAFFILANHPRA